MSRAAAVARPIAAPATPRVAVDKSRVTTIISIGLIGIGTTLEGFAGQLVLTAGLFAFSGAVTNWLAIHMLFEKIPGLYGAGVVQARFEAIRTEIRNLIIEQFFDREHIEQALSGVVSGGPNGPAIDGDAIAAAVDTDAAFKGLVDVVMGSRLGGALGMMGGAAALEQLREPFELKTREMVAALAADPAVVEAIAGAATSGDTAERVQDQVTAIIDRRVEDLTPGLVKQIVQRMIRDYLGWLVVWGGVFGGVIGLVAAVFTA